MNTPNPDIENFFRRLFKLEEALHKQEKDFEKLLTNIDLSKDPSNAEDYSTGLSQGKKFVKDLSIIPSISRYGVLVIQRRDFFQEMQRPVALIRSALSSYSFISLVCWLRGKNPAKIIPFPDQFFRDLDIFQNSYNSYTAQIELASNAFDNLVEITKFGEVIGKVQQLVKRCTKLNNKDQQFASEALKLFGELIAANTQEHFTVLYKQLFDKTSEDFQSSHFFSDIIEVIDLAINPERKSWLEHLKAEKTFVSTSRGELNSKAGKATNEVNSTQQLSTSPAVVQNVSSTCVNSTNSYITKNTNSNEASMPSNITEKANNTPNLKQTYTIEGTLRRLYEIDESEKKMQAIAEKIKGMQAELAKIQPLKESINPKSKNFFSNLNDLVHILNKPQAVHLYDIKPLINKIKINYNIKNLRLDAEAQEVMRKLFYNYDELTLVQGSLHDNLERISKSSKKQGGLVQNAQMYSLSNIIEKFPNNSEVINGINNVLEKAKLLSSNENRDIYLSLIVLRGQLKSLQDYYNKPSPTIKEQFTKFAQTQYSWENNFKGAFFDQIKKLRQLIYEQQMQVEAAERNKVNSPQKLNTGSTAFQTATNNNTKSNDPSMQSNSTAKKENNTSGKQSGASTVSTSRLLAEGAVAISSLAASLCFLAWPKSLGDTIKPLHKNIIGGMLLAVSAVMGVILIKHYQDIPTRISSANSSPLPSKESSKANIKL